MPDESWPSTVIYVKNNLIFFTKIRLQITLSEKGTKITPQTHIRKFENPQFLGQYQENYNDS